MFKDKEYLQSLMKIGVPIALQQLLFASFALLDTLMMGQMGEQSIAAVGLANQVTFVYNMITFGITNGASIFSAQYWGVRDIKGIHKVMRLTLMLSAAAGVLFMAIAVFIPELALSFYTNDVEVIRLGSQYLRIIGFNYLLTGIYFTFSTILRTTHHVKLPTAISVAALGGNMLLNYALIFGRLGMPQLGVRGAALGTMLMGIFQIVALVSVVYLRKLPAAMSFKGLRKLEISFVQAYIKTCAPVLINETMWALAITTINSIYAHISTESVAAVNISSTVEQFFFVFGIGIASATGILVGNQVGAGNAEKANLYASRSIKLSAGVSLLMGAIIFLTAPLIVNYYQVSDLTRFFAIRLMRVSGSLLWMRSMVMNWVIGVLRPGGDTRFTLLADGVIIWVVGVPMAYLGANVLHLPVYWVYLMVTSEEFVKNIVCFYRFRSGKWINQLTGSGDVPVSEALAAE